MQLKTLLNRVQKHSSFVYETVRLVEHPRLAIEVEVRPRANARAKCSQCGRAAPGYDTLPPRCFAFVALPVVFLYGDTPGGVCALRGEGRVRPVGDGQAPGDRCLLPEPELTHRFC